MSTKKNFKKSLSLISAKKAFSRSLSPGPRSVSSRRIPKDTEDPKSYLEESTHGSSGGFSNDLNITSRSNNISSGVKVSSVDSQIDVSSSDTETYTLTFTEQRLGLKLRALQNGLLQIAGYGDFDPNSNETRRKPKIGAYLVGMEDIQFQGREPSEVMEQLKDAQRPFKLHFAEKTTDLSIKKRLNTPALSSANSGQSTMITVTGRVGIWQRLMGTYVIKDEGRIIGGKPVYWKGHEGETTGQFLYRTEKSGRWGITDRENNLDKGVAGIGANKKSDSATDKSLEFQYYEAGTFIPDDKIKAFEGPLATPTKVSLLGGIDETTSGFMGMYERVEDRLINGRPVYRKELGNGKCHWLSNAPNDGKWGVHADESHINGLRPEIESSEGALLPHEALIYKKKIKISDDVRYGDTSISIIEGDIKTPETVTVTGRQGPLSFLMGDYHRIDGKHMNGFSLYKLSATNEGKHVDAYLFRTFDTGRWGISDSDKNRNENKCSIRAIAASETPVGEDLRFEALDPNGDYVMDSHITLKEENNTMTYLNQGAISPRLIFSMASLFLILAVAAASYADEFREVLDGLIKLVQ